MKNKEEVEDIFQDIPEENRLLALKDNALKTEVMDVKRPFTQEQLDEFKEQLSDDCVSKMTLDIAMAKEKEEFAAMIKEKYTSKIGVLSANIKDSITKLKDKKTTSGETVYLMDDQDSGMMNIFDKNGIFLHQRRLFPEERQTRIVPMAKTGTND